LEIAMDHASTGRHPRHDALRAEHLERYRRSYPEAGYHVVERPYGWVQRHESTMHRAQLTLMPVVAEPLERVLDDVRREFALAELTVRIDDHEVEEELAGTLEALGGVRGSAVVVLAYLGETPEEAPLDGVTIEPVDASDDAALTAWAHTKLRGFAQGAEPSSSALQAECELWRSESVFARYWIARLDGREAGTLACYVTEDWQVFSLATLPEDRGRGIARMLLGHAVRESASAGALSISINCDPDDWPITWYRRFGFVDEVARAYRFTFE
jgi:ribosomal protein S18 acetylase RimI-like enzyme